MELAPSFTALRLLGSCLRERLQCLVEFCFILCWGSGNGDLKHGTLFAYMVAEGRNLKISLIS
eukprot:3091580-Amphidinium_carterae.1